MPRGLPKEGLGRAFLQSGLAYPQGNVYNKGEVRKC